MNEEWYLTVGQLEQHLAEREEKIEEHVDVDIDPVHNEQTLEAVAYEFDRLKKLARRGRIGGGATPVDRERIRDAIHELETARDMVARCAVESTGPPRSELSDAEMCIDDAICVLEEII